MKKDVYVKIALVLGFAMIYASLRYIYFGPHAVAQIPSYIVNKATSLSAVFFLLFSAYSRYRDDMTYARFWGKASLAVAALHVFLSFPLLGTVTYYDKFFMTPQGDITEMMNLKGEIMLLTGAVASLVYMMISSRRPRAITLLMTIATIMVCMHVGVMGVMGWLHPENWYGGMPPITLLSFLVAVPAFWFLLVRQPKQARSVPDPAAAQSHAGTGNQWRKPALADRVEDAGVAMN